MALKAFMVGLARLMAILGGIVLCILVVLTCLSVLGRAMNGVFHSGFMKGLAPDFSQKMIDIGIGPINGDFELVEAGVAFAVFAFIPLCQVTAGHATVDVMVTKFPAVVKRALLMLTDIVFAAILIVIAWKLYDGMSSKMRYGETTFLLQFPIWWAYACSFVGAFVSAVVGSYVALVRVYETFTGRIIIWDGQEAEQ